MKTTNRNEYMSVIKVITARRNELGITQGQLAVKLGVTQANISKIESTELRLDIVQLIDWTNALDMTLEECLSQAGLIQLTSNSILSRGVLNTSSDAIPIGVEDADKGANLILGWREKRFKVFFPNVKANHLSQVEKTVASLFKSLNTLTTMKNRDAIAQALEFAFTSIPDGNPSDIYHHLIYRLYLREYQRTNAPQSWARAGGEGLEVFFKKHYEPIFAPHNIVIRLAFEEKIENRYLEEMRIAHLVAGKSKLDIGLYGEVNGKLVPFGGVHSKASLAERVSDDKPCSEKMMENGFLSYLFTLDAKSFPPPTGDLINRGELGSPTTPSDKRNYIEKSGSFDACFSYNLRTVSSPQKTESGKRIYVSKFDKNDAFVTTVLSDWKKWKGEYGK